MYADYIKELMNRECKYTDHCFVTYNINGKQISVIDYYCDKEKRGTKYMLEFMEKFFKDLKADGYEQVFGFTDERNTEWEKSERLMIKFGFKKLDKLSENYNNYMINLQEL